MSEHITRRRTISALVLLAMLAWLLWPNNQLVRVQALQRELASEASKTLSPEARQAKRQELRSAMEKLSPSQKDELAAEGRDRMQGEMARYVGLSAAEKKAYLDKQIDRMEQFQKSMAKGKPAGASPNAGPPGSQVGGPPGGGSSKGPQTPEDRERRRQQRLDHSTPELRGYMDVFRRDMEQRRRERGLPPSPSRGR